MSRRAPSWKRKGYQSEVEYRGACAATRKTRRAAMAATEARGIHLLVLEKMWSRAEFDRPQVTVTKEQLMSDIGCSLRTIKTALTKLRSEGSIKPFKDWQGGRGVPTCWSLRVAGAQTTAAECQVEAMEASRNRDAAWRFLRDKYGPLKALEIMGPRETGGDNPETACG